MQHLLEAEQLTALNTWGKSGNRALSFLNARTGGTLIDFALCRLSEADGAAKQAHMPLLPFVPPTGMRHKPVCGSIACSALVVRTSGRPNFRRQVQTAIQTTPGILAAFKVRLQQVLPDDQCCPTAQLNDKLQQAWQQVAQLRRSDRPSRPGRPDGAASGIVALDVPVTECIIALWRLRRQCRQPLTMQLGAFLQRWRLLAQHARLTRALHKHCRQRKRIKFDRLLADASNSPGMTQLYKVVQRAAPRQHRRRLQLRDEQGLPQSAEQELQCIQGFYEKLYMSSSGCPAAQTVELAMPQFSAQEIQTALQGLPAGKALPSDYMPAILWKEAAEVVAPSMEQALHACPGRGTLVLGPEWHSAQMCLMPKPGKPLKSVSDLRPIELLSPVAKSLAKMAANRLRPFVQRAVEGLPLFAYISGRQAGDALDRVFAHCAHVRKIAKGAYNPIARKAGESRADCLGGIQLSLDLSKAYRQALQRARVEEELINLIFYVHAKAELVFQHADNTASVKLGRGLRQGCGLWVLYTVPIVEDILQHTPSDCITAFADDFHGQWVFHNPGELQACLSQIKHIVWTLRDHGVDISFEKTVVLMKHTGGKAAWALRKVTHKDKQGQRFLVLPHFDEKLRIPIKPQHVYLGAVISYHNFEKLTLQYRVKQMWTTFHRLFQVLRANVVPVSKRLQLWRSTCFATLTYGLTSCGLPADGPCRLASIIARQVRLVTKSPSFVTHEDNAALWLRLGLEDPILSLRRLLEKRLQTVQDNGVASLQSERVHQWYALLPASFCGLCFASSASRVDQSALGVRAGTDRTEQPASLTEVTAVAEVLCCHVCGLSFASRASLRAHVTRKHQGGGNQNAAKAKAAVHDKNLRSQYMVHSVEGLPKCKHCLKEFSGWPQYVYHFTNTACTVLHAEQRPPPHPRCALWFFPLMRIVL